MGTQDQGIRGGELLRITAPHFCAGVVLGELLNQCAPIIGYMRTWNMGKIRDYCQKKNWRMEVLSGEEEKA